MRRRAHTDHQARPPGGPLSGPAANYTRGTTPVTFEDRLARWHARAQDRLNEAWADADRWVALGYEGSFFHAVATLRAAWRELVIGLIELVERRR